MTIKIDDNTLYDTPTLAKILGFTERTIRKLLREKKFIGRKIGKKWLVPGSAIKAYFEYQNHENDKK